MKRILQYSVLAAFIPVIISRQYLRYLDVRFDQMTKRIISWRLALA